MTTLHFGAYRVELSNTEKPLFPDAGINKGELIRYYRTIAPLMLPHLRNRPLTLHRFPDGIGADGFYQQQMPDHFPDWIGSWRAAHGDEGDADVVRHILCNNRATLAYLANQAAITLHGWLARAPRLHAPDRLIFDLDPPDDDFSVIRQAARWVVQLMQAIGLAPFVMTTGSRGLHVVAPLRSELDFDAVREIAQAMATLLAGQHPEILTVAQRKSQRRGRIYLDIMRNAYGQTSVMPYAVRALPGAPVATPLSLDELGDSGLGPRHWHLKNILRRMGQKDDPWRDIQRHARSPRKARNALQRLQREQDGSGAHRHNGESL
jgi:bifunctional non-homologous end joining protein LigD